MSLQSFQQSINRSKQICEAAAPVAELTSLMKPNSEFKFPSAGINLATLTMNLRASADSRVTVTDDGSTITVVTNNPNAAEKVFRTMKVAGVEMKGNAFTVSDTAVANTDSVLLGESKNRPSKSRWNLFKR